MTKDDLVDTALRLWKEKGYRNVSVTEICRECGVTKGSYYHHFSSKKELLFYRYKMTVMHNFELYKNEIDDQKSRIRSVQMIFELFTSSILQFNDDMILTMLSKNDEYNVFDESYFNDFIPQIIPCYLQDHIIKGINTGEIREINNPSDYTEILSASLLGNLMIWCYQDKSFDLIKFDNKIIELILKK